MQWKNHRLTTCAITFALTGSFPATAIATAASALPDVIELKMVKHRTLTHYPWLVVVPAGLVRQAMQSAPGYVLYITFFIMVGYLCHLVADFLSNTGIPLWSPFGKPFGCRLYVTHSPSEDAVALAITAIAVIYGWHNGLFTQAYLMGAGNNLAIFVSGMAHEFSGR